MIKDKKELSSQIVENVFDCEVEDESTIKNYVELDYDLYCFTICALISPEKFSPTTLMVLVNKA